MSTTVDVLAFVGVAAIIGGILWTAKKVYDWVADVNLSVERMKWQQEWLGKDQERNRTKLHNFELRLHALELQQRGKE